MERRKTLLVVLAHPDDETFGTGGTIALYAKQGVDVHLICATRGEVGDVDPKFMEGFKSIADRRESELRCAAGLLGLKGVYFLDYRDSGMPGSPDNQHANALVAQPLDDVAKKVAHFVRLLKPQVVITFDPIGGYRHPDHIAIHQATVRAFDFCNDPQAFSDSDGLPPFLPEKLYFHTIPHTYLRIGVFLLRLIGRDPRHFGRNKDIDIASIAEVSFPINARVNYRPVAPLRDQASACHESQGGTQMASGLMGWLRRLTASTDTYMRAIPPAQKGRIEHDLFEGTA